MTSRQIFANFMTQEPFFCGDFLCKFEWIRIFNCNVDFRIWRIINWSQLHTKLLSTTMSTMRLLTCFPKLSLYMVTSVKFRATTLLINNINYSVSLKGMKFVIMRAEFCEFYCNIFHAIYLLLLQKLTNKNWQCFGAHLF